ncbi:hypothetical protein [Mesorhizobium sp. CN2-181]|uniref:hypothetical protein n=1 Tax=Mesorhizobium yinganensis TaxID=3157707 RepID=UPI0032B87EC8
MIIVVAAVAWWAVTYAQVMNNTGFPLQRALPCPLPILRKRGLYRHDYETETLREHFQAASPAHSF